MGMLYAWATPEYLLWRMTIGQVILMHNRAMEIKYPDPDKKESEFQSADDVVAKREELRKLYGAIDGKPG
jgi:hypothetical protein